MAHDDASLHHSGFVRDSLPCLPHHFRQRFLCPVGIVRRPDCNAPPAPDPYFEVRQVNIHQSVQQPRVPPVLIPAGVVHDGQISPLARASWSTGASAGSIMGGVARLMLAAPVFQEKKMSRSRSGEMSLPALPSEISVLAKACRLQPEKHRARFRFPRKCTALPSNAAPPGHPQRIRYAAAPRCPSLRFAPQSLGRDGEGENVCNSITAPQQHNMA